ncbi:phosphopentomutase [Eubacteriales bacterium OttesenSCG-928-N14]|nr:phosphopentomutase [Eubacteriales bacterium OttesenSCG-928-N14]
MAKKVILIVMDSAGVGALPDAHRFGDAGSDTLGHIIQQKPDIKLPTMKSLGLYNIVGTSFYQPVAQPVGCFGKSAEQFDGKDTTGGHWEIAGLVLDKPFPTFHDGFPPAVIQPFEAAIGRGILGNYAASGTVIIQDLGDEHVATGKPIVYTSADSVFQIAAHEDVISVPELYDMCEKARKILVGDYAVGRVIARPFTGTSGNYTRTKNRKDFSVLPPHDTVLDAIKAKGLDVAGVGKIEDIFANQGLTKSNHTTDNAGSLDTTIAFMKQDFEGLIFTNLVDFDMLYGHRDDVDGYAKALEYADAYYPKIMEQMGQEDILIITADHGCDPTFPGSDHTREYIPILCYGKGLKQGVDLGIRNSFADIGCTIAAYFGIDWNVGNSFLNEIKGA